MVFGPQKLPELARMLGKATAEFRKMTNDFRFALEDEVRELDRQARIREEETAAAAALAAQPPVPAALPAPEGAVPRATPEEGVSAPPDALSDAGHSSHADSEPAQTAQPEEVSVPQEKPSDDHTAV
jgi:Sec-independent protein translocase protein TatA